MNRNPVENENIASRLLRKQAAMSRRPIQFSLRSLLFGVTASCIFVGTGRYLVVYQPLDIPLPIHIWFFALWGVAIAGMIISQSAWRYVMGGTIGVGITSPILLSILMNDRELVPFTTCWCTLFVFAIFANLGGGIFCLRNNHVRVGAIHVAAFVGSGFGMLLLLSRGF